MGKKWTQWNGQKKESIPLPLLQRNLGSSLAAGNLVCARPVARAGKCGGNWPLEVDLVLVGIRPLTCSSSLTELELLPKVNSERRGSDKRLAGATGVCFGSDLDR